jgi:hypothetical protein
MTIIVTHISQHGIIHAADSNLTDSKGKQAGTGQKLFKIPRLGSALTVAGNYSVGSTSMDTWMRDFISNDASESLAKFVDNLRDTINRMATINERQNGYFIHVAGYAGSRHTYHPEFYYITNYQIDRQTGGYSVPDTTLHSQEDFWSQNSSTPLSSLFVEGKGFIYCNGYPSGRQAYFALLQRMSEYRSSVWSEPSWNFRPPQNVNEEAAYLKNDMEHIKLLFLYSNYTAPYIGGDIEIHPIPYR